MVVHETLSVDGSYQYSITATSGTAASTNILRNIYLDATAPEIAISSIQEKVYLTEVKTITGTASDSGSGIARVEITLDDVVYWYIATGKESWTCDVPDSTEGFRSLTAKVTDMAGNETTAPYNYINDIAPATVTETAIGTTSTVDDGDGIVTLTGTATASTPATVSISRDGTPIAPSVTVTDTNWTFTDAGLLDGLHTYEITASSTHETSTITRSVLVDTQAPTVTVMVGQNATFTAYEHTFSGTINDEASGILSLEYQIQGDTVWNPIPVNMGAWSFSFNDPVNGVRSLTLRATDNKAHSVDIPVSYTNDYTGSVRLT